MSARTPKTGPHRVHCKSCDFSKRYTNHADAASHQRRRPCPNCDRMLAVAPVRVATDGGRSTSETEQPPVWEIGIRAWGHDDEPGEARWDHYHPKAENEETAKEKAVEEAKSGLNSLIGRFDGYEVYMVEGPFEQSSTETDRDIRTDGGEEPASASRPAFYAELAYHRDVTTEQSSSLGAFEVPALIITGLILSPVIAAAVIVAHCRTKRELRRAKTEGSA